MFFYTQGGGKEFYGHVSIRSVIVSCSLHGAHRAELQPLAATVPVGAGTAGTAVALLRAYL